MDTVTYTISPPDPVKVLKTSQSGDKRAQALQRLREPLRNGGTQVQQDEMIELLTYEATRSPNPLCRLQAIGALGRFEDPRAPKILTDAYYSSKDFPLEHTNNLIKQKSLASLSLKNTPEARTLLIQVARANARESISSERQYTTDERLAAIRGLANYKASSDSVTTLVHILKTDEDIAIRNSAHEALKTATGKNLPADVTRWEQYVYGSGNGNTNRGGTIQQVSQPPKTKVGSKLFQVNR